MRRRKDPGEMERDVARAARKIADAERRRGIVALEQDRLEHLLLLRLGMLELRLRSERDLAVELQAFYVLIRHARPPHAASVAGTISCVSRSERCAGHSARAAGRPDPAAPARRRARSRRRA